MNRRKKKEWLQEAWNLAATVDYCDMIISDPSVYSSPAFGERVMASPTNSREAKVAARLAQLDKAVKERDRAMAELEKRKAAVNRLKDGNQKKVLWLRYICHYSWEDVCLSVNYSRSRANVIHNAAIDALTV